MCVVVVLTEFNFVINLFFHDKKVLKKKDAFVRGIKRKEKKTPRKGKGEKKKGSTNEPRIPV